MADARRKVKHENAEKERRKVKKKHDDLKIYENLQVWTWVGAKQFCFKKGKKICNFAEYCPPGADKPVAGTIPGIRWAPIGDLPDDWVQIGDQGDVCTRSSEQRVKPTPSPCDTCLQKALCCGKPRHDP